MQLLRSPKIVTSTGSHHFFELQRTVRKPKSMKHPEGVIFIARCNYKGYADIGLLLGLMNRTLAVLDTEACPDFTQSLKLPLEAVNILSYGPLLDICNANINPLRTLGTIKLTIRSGRYFALVIFIVCEELSAPVILGTGLCNLFVESTSPREKLFDVEGLTTVTIVRRPLKRAPRRKSLPTEQESPLKGGRASSNIRMSTRITFPRQSQ